MAAESDSRPSVWRTTVWQRALWILGAIAAIGMGASVVSIAASEGAWLEGLAFVLAFFVAPFALGLRYAFRARVELTDPELVVVSTLSAHHVPWTEIDAAIPSYSGLRIYLKGGGSILAGAVQKSNLSVWFGRRTRADDLADEISRRSGASEIGKHFRA
jgi:hypothetical protein